jgi:hypothetical protein
MEDNIIIEEVEFSEKLYKKNIKENEFNTEYEAGEEDANN